MMIIFFTCKKGCKIFYKARFEIKPSKSKDKWIPVAVWRKNGPGDFTAPVPLPVLPMGVADFNMSLRPQSLELALEGVFHVKETVFGLALHNILQSKGETVIYGLIESLRTKKGDILASGRICSGLTHKNSPSATGVFAIPVGNHWRKANAVVTNNLKLTCCGNVFYEYQVHLSPFQKKKK